MSIEIGLHARVRPLSIEGEQLRWAGPLTEGAPIVQVTASGAWVDAIVRRDVLAIDQPPGPVPPGLWRAIAEATVASPQVAVALTSDLLRTADWRRALQRAAWANGVVPRPCPPREATPLASFSSPLVSVLSLGGADWVALTQDELVFSRGHRLTRPTGGRLVLLRPLRPEDSPAMAVVEGTCLALTDVSPDGPVGPTLFGEVPGQPLAVATGRDGRWVLTETHIAFFPIDTACTPALVRACAVTGPGMGCLVSGQHLVVASARRFERPIGWKTDHLYWVDLEGSDIVTLPWTFATVGMWHEGRLYTVHAEGVRRTTWEGSALVSTHPESTCVAWMDGKLAIAGRLGWVGDAVWLDQAAYAVVCVPGGVVWRTQDGVRIQHPRANLVWQGVDELSVVYWKGYVALVFGDNLALWSPDGTLVVRTLPHTGQLWGAWDEGVVVGPPSGGRPARPCTALVAVSWDGTRRDRLVWSARWANANSPHAEARLERARSMVVNGRVLLGGYKELGEWRPRLEPMVLAAAEPVRTLRGLRRPAVYTYNPRDDWPIPGLAVEDEEVVVIDAECAGTTGIAPAPGLSVGRDGTVVAVKCQFTGGVALSAGSFLWALDCGDLGLVSCAEGAGWFVLASQSASA